MGVKLTADATEFHKVMLEARDTIKSAGASMAKLGSDLSIKVTAPLAALGLFAVKTFSDFDDAMVKSISIMGNLTNETKRAMKEQARALSREGIQSSADLAKAYFFLASAGLDANRSIAALPVVQKFATAGAFDLEKATSLLVDAQSALGLASADAGQYMVNLTRLADVLTKANIMANGSVEQFAAALTNKAAAALRLSNKSMEEGVAVLAAFADQGLKGEGAGEALAIVLRDLQRAAITEKETWKKFGLTVFDTTGKMRPLVEIIADLEKKFGMMSDAQKRSAAEMLGFQDRSFSNIQMLMGTSQKIRDYEKALRDAGGVTEDVANKQMMSFASQMKVLQNNLTDVAFEIGRELVPYIRVMAEEVKKATAWWRALTQESKTFIVLMGVLVGVLGPAIVALGTYYKWFAAIISISNTWLVLIVATVSALAVLTDVILQMTGKGNLGILDLVTSFRVGGVKILTWMMGVWIQVFETWEEVKTRISESWEDLKNIVLGFGSLMLQGMLKVAEKISEALLGALNILTGKIFDKKMTEAGNKVREFFEDQRKQSRDTAHERHQMLSDIRRSNAFVAGIRQSVTRGALATLFQADQGEADRQRVGGPSAEDDRADALSAKIRADMEQGEAANAAQAAQGPGPGGKFTMPNLDDEKKRQQFEVINLRRFALDGPASLTKPKREKQETKDEKTHELLQGIKKNQEKATPSGLG